MEQGQAAKPLLHGFRALDLTDLRGQLCGRLLADLGVEVVKLEAAAGDPVRRLGSGGKADGLLFAHLNAGKKSIVLDYRQAENRERFLALVRGADILLESFEPGFLESLGLGYHDLAKVNPGLVMASITGFGQTGPYRDLAYNDIVVYAMSGLMSLAGDPARPPCRPPETQAYYYGSLMAALGVVSALHGGAGDWIDVSMQEALASQESLIRMSANEGITLHRQGSKHAHIAPASIFPCSDGYVYLYVNGTNWVKFLEIWDDHPAELDDPALIGERVRAAKADFINARLASFTRRYAKEELTAMLQARKIPCVPVQRPSEWVRDPQATARGVFASGEDGAAVRMGPPFRLNGVRPAPGRPPDPGEHQELLNSWPDRPSAKREPAQGRPLAGMRVLSFDQVLAGPYGANMLAAMGADIIKVESRGTGARRAGLDPFRYFGPSGDPDLSPRFLEYNRNKRSLTVNLKSAEGPELIRRMAARSNAVLDNFATHVMPSLALGHAEFQRSRPDIVTLRMPGLGCSGPKSGYATLGPSILAMIGFTYLWNHPDAVDPPIGSQMVWPDYVSSLIAAILLVAGTIFQRRVGCGVEIDLSQAEAAAYLFGATLLQANGQVDELRPIGNASPHEVLQGCYPTKGDDCWCVIAVETELHWNALLAAMAREDLAADPRFADGRTRRSNQLLLDELIAAWTGLQDGQAIMDRLQAAGIPCGRVLTAKDLIADPHLRARGFIETQEHARIGRFTLPGMPLRFLHAPDGWAWDFPTLGQHNGAICEELLGLSPQEIEAMERIGTLG